MLLTTPLVGRAAEMGALRQAVDRLEAGGGGVVVLEGEPGIGKSRLVGEAVSAAAGGGLVTLLGACSELEAESSFAPVSDALDLDAAEAGTERAALRALVNAERLPSLTEAEHRVRLTHAFSEFIARCCDRQGTLLALEDVHWADPATLLLLERLSRRCAHLSLLLLLTMRPQPRPPPLHLLLASLETLGSEHFLVSPLAEPEVKALVEASLEATAGDGILSAVRGAAGNPFFVGEALATLEQENALEVDDGVVDVAGAEVVPPLRLASVRRLSFLPQRCMDLLRTASMLGSEFEVDELSVVTGSPTIELAPILGEAIASNVLHEAGTRLAFRHDLVREAIYNDRPPAINQALHQAAARSLRDAGYPPLKVAAHLLRGPRHPGDQATPILRSVAQECRYSDPSVAVELLERVSASVSDADAAVVDVKAELANALIWAGRWSDGERLARELALTERRPGRSTEVLVTLVQVSALTGALPESVVREIDAAAHAPGLEPHQVARLMTAAAQAAFLEGDLRSARRLATEALDAAQRAGDTMRRAEASMLLGSICWHQGRPKAGLAAAEEALALTARLSPELGGDAQVPYLLLAMNLGLLGRYEEAVPALQLGMEHAERANNVWVLAQLHQALGVSQFYAGALDAAEGEFDAALILWHEVGAADWATVQDAWLGRIAVHRGDVSAARRQLAPADVDLPPGSDWKPARNVPVVSLTRAMVSEAQGDPAAAFAALEEARRTILDSGAAYFNLRIGPEFVRLAVDCGDQEAAAAMTVATEAVAASVGTPTARAQALRCRGLLTGDATVLLEAVAAHREGPSRIELAGAAEETATALAASGASNEAAAMLREALEIWERAGASYDASRVLARLRAAGARPGKRGSRRRAQTGWDSLTDSEHRVLELVREGLTYREVAERLFVSRRTVETHVARVFRKLEVGSRAELSALLFERGPAAR